MINGKDYTAEQMREFHGRRVTGRREEDRNPDECRCGRPIYRRYKDSLSRHFAPICSGCHKRSEECECGTGETNAANITTNALCGRMYLALGVDWSCTLPTGHKENCRRKLVEQLSHGSATRIIETIRVIAEPYRTYPFYQPYYAWCSAAQGASAGPVNGSGLMGAGANLAGTQAGVVVGPSNESKTATAFSSIKTF